MTSIYRPILKIAWQILWRAKYLWFFGLFAVLIGNSGELNLVINNFSSISEGAVSLSGLKELYLKGTFGSFSANARVLLANFNWAALVLLLILLALAIFVIWLSVVSQAGLINGAYKEYHKQPSDFASSFKIGRQNFWRVLGINIIGKFIIYGILLIIGLPLTLMYLRQASETGQLLLILLSFIILIPLAVIISFLVKYAVIFAILKKESVGQAIKSGWQLFIKNWIVSIEMAIILFLVSIAAIIVMILAAIVLTIPLSLLLYIFYALKVQGLLMLVVVLSLALFILLLFWISALLSTYQMISWVLLFDRLTESQVYSKIARLVARWMSRGKKEKTL